jgi:hypothetical protein
LDADINQLVKALQYTDINQDIYTFNPCNLDKVWNDTPNKWNSQTTKIKYDYIIANFPLMHFCTDAFWLQLNEIVHYDDTNNEWILHDSYLQIKDNKTVYKFEWIHNEYIKKYN